MAKFFKANYNKDMLEKELSLKGWNWGTAKFNGAVLSFNIGSNTAFEIPLHYVSQCNTGKNEVTLEFHQVCKDQYKHFCFISFTYLMWFKLRCIF